MRNAHDRDAYIAVEDTNFAQVFAMVDQRAQTGPLQHCTEQPPRVLRHTLQDRPPAAIASSCAPMIAPVHNGKEEVMTERNRSIQSLAPIPSPLASATLDTRHANQPPRAKMAPKHPLAGATQRIPKKAKRT